MIRITAGGVPQAPLNFIAGSTSITVAPYTFTPGDTIKIEQPAGTPLETFTIPNVSLAGAVGSASLTGHAPDGTVTIASFNDTCYGFADDDFTVQPQGGAFAVAFPKPLVAGSIYSVLSYPGKGDTVRYEDRIPGETPCIGVSAGSFPTPLGEAPDPTPYMLLATNLRQTVTTGARIVLRRGGAIVADHSNAATTSSIFASTAVQALPGDVFELYRPHTAGAPSTTFTVPDVRAVYDPGNSLVAIDGPAASYVQTSAGLSYAMFSSERFALNTQPGRTLLDFASGQSFEKPFNLAQADFILTSWHSQDATRTFRINAARGDLTAPTVSVKLARKFKLGKLGSSISANVTSSEAVTAKLTLTLPGRLKTSAAKPKAPRVVATAKVTLAAGVTKVKIKFTRSGKKLIKKMRKKKYPTNKATLTVAATDFSGNAATATRSTKLVPK
ncbi:MAG: hypothetical protein ACSLFF_05365 [Solirubrobacterales bacterium]